MDNTPRKSPLNDILEYERRQDLRNRKDRFEVLVQMALLAQCAAHQYDGVYLMAALEGVRHVDPDCIPPENQIRPSIYDAAGQYVAWLAPPRLASGNVEAVDKPEWLRLIPVHHNN